MSPDMTEPSPWTKACEECRRRKIKCDRSRPTCDLCQRADRMCVYQPRTANRTKRELAALKAELAQTKAQLQSAEESLRRESVIYEISLPAVPLSLRSSPNTQEQTTNDNPFLSNTSDGEIDHTGSRPLPSVLNAHISHETDLTTGVTSERPNDTQESPESHTSKASDFITDPPSMPIDLEWDEHETGSTRRALDDGMASLTSGSNRGYLGVASGAALLRMTDKPHDTTEEAAALPTSPAPYAITSIMLEEFMNKYFSLFHLSYPIVHEATFRAQFACIIPRPHGDAWLVLLYMISAIGALSASTEPTDVDLHLFETAKKHFSAEILARGNLTTVQALSLIGNYLQKRGKPNSGYNYAGLSRRVAMGIGLHKEFSNWDVLTLEMRRRVWWCLYVFDVGGTITFSRPMEFPVDGIESRLPSNLHDVDVTAQTVELPDQVNETTVYSHLRAQVTFHLATKGVYSRMISSPYPTADEMIQLDDACIGSWLNSLPEYYRDEAPQGSKFRLAHAIMRWRYRNFRVLMYRPFVVGRYICGADLDGSESTNGKPSGSLAIKRCLQAAEETITLISEFWVISPPTMMGAWYSMYFLFQAILIPVICLRNDPRCDMAESWRYQITQAMDVMKSISSIDPSAQRSMDVISSLCGSFLFNGQSLDKSPANESLQAQLNDLYPMLWPTLDSAQLESNDMMWQEPMITSFINQVHRFDE